MILKMFQHIPNLFESIGINRFQKLISRNAVCCCVSLLWLLLKPCLKMVLVSMCALQKGRGIGVGEFMPSQLFNEAYAGDEVLN